MKASHMFSSIFAAGIAALALVLWLWMAGNEEKQSSHGQTASHMPVLTVAPVAELQPEPVLDAAEQDQATNFVQIGSLCLVADDAGVRLGAPSHTVHFQAERLMFWPHRGQPNWHWSLDQIRVGDASLPNGPAPPFLDGNTVVYRRGEITEQYIPSDRCIEQQFVLDAPPSQHGDDLVITGAIASEGIFSPRSGGGWEWRNSHGATTLGDVFVFDATGKELPATLVASNDSTTIRGFGAALASASYPVTIDPEIGIDDMKISDRGGDPINTEYSSRVAYNHEREEYFVVWTGRSPEGNDIEAYGQLVDASTGAAIGDRVQITFSTGIFGRSFHRMTAVAYNATDNYYLVVQGRKQEGKDLEFYSHRVSDTGTVQGVPIQISKNGLENDGEGADFGLRPDLAWNANDNEFLCVWVEERPIDGGDVRGQRLDGSTRELVGEMISISHPLVTENTVGRNNRDNTEEVSVVHSTTDNRYLVVYDEYIDLTGGVGGGAVNYEWEIFGQFLNADGTDAGPINDLRISTAGPSGDIAWEATQPDVAWNSTSNQYLVVWRQDDNSIPGLADDEFEIWGTRIASNGLALGFETRISAMGPDGNPNFTARDPSVAYNAASDKFLVTWAANNDERVPDPDRFEVYGQFLTDDLSPIHCDDFRISRINGEGGEQNQVQNLTQVEVVAGSGRELFVVWDGKLPVAGAASRHDIFGQRISDTVGRFQMRDFTNLDADVWLTYTSLQGFRYTVQRTNDLKTFTNMETIIGCGGLEVYRETGAYLDHDRLYYRVEQSRRIGLP